MVQPRSFSMKTVSHPSGTSHWKGENIYTFLQAHQSGQFEDSSILQPYLLTLEGEHVCVCVCVCVCELLGCVQLFAPPRTEGCQVPLSLGFSRQKYWSRLPFPSPGDLPDPGIILCSSALQADLLASEPQGKPPCPCANFSPGGSDPAVVSLGCSRRCSRPQLPRAPVLICGP